MRTVIFLPGLLSDAIVWQPVADALPHGTPRTIADLGQPASIAAMAAHALALADGDLILVGHSMGGRVAMEAAHQAPSRVKALVLANTGHGPLKIDEAPKRQALIELGHASMDALADQWLPPMVAPANRANATLMQALKSMVLRAGALQHERQLQALMARPDAGAYLPQIACPILLIAATEDGWSPIAQHRQIASLAADAELAIIEDAGHFAPIEAPDRVAETITAWLARRALF